MRSMVRSASLGLFLGLLGLTICDAGVAHSIGAAANWPGHGGDTDESDYSRLDQIKSANVAQLGLAWSLDLPGETSLEATPLAVDGVLYFTGSYGKVYAVDGASGKLLWKYDPEIWKHNPAQDASRIRGQSRRGLCRRADLLGDARRPAVRARCQDRQAALERRDHRAASRCKPSPARRAPSTARSSSAMAARTSARAAMSPPMTRRPASRSGASMWRRARPRRTAAIRRWSAPPPPGTANTGRPAPAAPSGTASPSIRS